MTSGQPWGNLPEELRQREQWLLAGPNAQGHLKVPLSVNFSGDIVSGSSTDRGTWLTFELACEYALERGYGIGFVLADDDPFTCVDYDVKNIHNEPDASLWTSEDHLRMMRMQVEDLASYTEQSLRGQGVHVWVRAKFEGTGLKRSGIEVYCRERFIVCTGRVVHRLPVRDAQDEIAHLVAEMRASAQAAGVLRADVLVSSEQELDDDEVMRRAWNAENGEKFRTLWEGRWQDYGYPSQSEADLSLMSMLTFYSRDNEQCRRLFRHSVLGQREKAVKDDRYLNFTLRLIRGRQAKEDAAAAQFEAAARAIAAQVQAQTAQQGPQAGPGATQQAPAGVDEGLPWPPGVAGRIAQFIYASAPRPVREVAVVGALGFLAGVCGKAWTIPGSGLNGYFILVARSGVGKEAMHSGISAILHRVKLTVPGAANFVVFSDFASGPALTKACAAHPSFVNVASEFGKKLKQLAQEGHAVMQGLRTVMTALYQKSGPTSLVGGITYSNKDNNVSTVGGVAYSMIGETTPPDLYESLTDSMMSDGFLSRFTIIESNSPRPPANRMPLQVPDEQLTELLCDLCMQALTQIHNQTTGHVLRTAEAGVLMDEFDLHCDAQINGSEDESYRQMWNRAHLKMCRIAALLAVADNCRRPVVTEEHVLWSRDVVLRNIELMQRRMRDGDIGTGDHARILKVVAMLHEYLSKPIPDSYGVPSVMQRDGVVPKKYLQIRTAQLNLFSSHKLGATVALDQTLKAMLDNGYLVEMDKLKAGEQYTFQGRCFRIVNLPRGNLNGPLR